VAAALLDSLGLDRVSVMGSSGGAAFAAAFAIHCPALAKSLVLLCPQLHRWDHPRWLPRSSRWALPLLKRRFLRGLLLRLYRLQMGRITARQLLQMEAGDRYPEISRDPAAIALAEQTLAAMRTGTKFPGFENDLVIFTTEDILGANGAVETPTLIIHDVQDPMAPAEHVEWFATHCRNCRQVSIRAAGHLIWVGPEADQMHQARVQFLREQSHQFA
jgi:pimeloyl-ACP methyl ester carboxylesterase